MISESQRLKARGADCWAAAVAHPMVAEIGAGSLPHATFRFYFEQNLGYLREYARAIAFAATATTDRGALSTLARFLGQIVDVEIPANEAFLERLGGSAARPVTMLPTTYAYTRHLLDATSRGGLAVALAALLPCQWSYGEIGQRLARSLPADPVYRDWIELFAATATTSWSRRPRTCSTRPAPGATGWRPRTRSTARRATRSRSGRWPTRAANVDSHQRAPR